MSDTFKDWIPEGQDTGAIGDGGYQDFVPAPEPKPQTVEPIVEQPQVEPVEVPSEPVVPPLEGGNE